MLDVIHNRLDPELIAEWQLKRHLPLGSIKRLVEISGVSQGNEAFLARLNQAFNWSVLSRESLRSASAPDSTGADLLLEMLVNGSEGDCRHEVLEDRLFDDLSARFWADQSGYLASGHTWYPRELDGRKVGFRTDWINGVLAEAGGRFREFASNRTSDIAVLVGNGPSLRNEDFSLLEGQDVFISNYAVKHPWLARIARGIAVSNPWVAAQEPYWFNLATNWKFFPFWHGDLIRYDQSCVFLNAYGSDLFFSTNVLERIAWHSTVTYFWLQILYSAGYRKVVLIGVDNSYQQQPELREGDLIEQKVDDPNHFDPAYFKGRRWQAADTGKMEETYAMAKVHYERDGREIVNCTTGGSLELFRRSQLVQEIHRASPHVKRRPASVIDENREACPAFVRAKLDLCLIEPEGGNCGEFLVEGRLAGRELVAVVGLQVAEGTEVDVTLTGGDSATAESSCKCFVMAGSGTKWISVRHLFSGNHEKVRILACATDGHKVRAPVGPARMFVMESPASIFNRLSSNDGLLAVANSLSLENQFLSSIPLYLYLSLIRPLKIYETASRSALGLMGITAPADQDAVLRLLGNEPKPSV